jgi:outer membrane autotransporter protein
MSSTFAQVEQRLNGLRLAEGSFNAPSLVSTGSAVSGLSAGDETATSQGMWLKGYGLDGYQGEKNGYAGYSSSGWGVAVGADRQLAPGLIGGVALSYSDTSVSYRDQLNGDSNGVTSTQISLYGSQDLGRFYVDGMLAYARQRYDSKRDTVVNGYTSGHFDGDQWGVRIGAGLPIALSDNTSITPRAHLEWLQIKQSSYTESGGGALALNVGANSADRLRSTLGAELEHHTVVGSVNASPFVRAFWHHDFKNDGVNSTASFVGGGSSFVTPGQNLDRDSFSIGAGVNFYAKKDFMATLAYDRTLGSAYHTDALQATVRWDF